MRWICSLEDSQDLLLGQRAVGSAEDRTWWPPVPWSCSRGVSKGMEGKVTVGVDPYSFPPEIFFLQMVKLDLGLSLGTLQSHFHPWQLLLLPPICSHLPPSCSHLPPSPSHLHKCLPSSPLPALLSLSVPRPWVSSRATYFSFILIIFF